MYSVTVTISQCISQHSGEHIDSMYNEQHGFQPNLVLPHLILHWDCVDAWQFHSSETEDFRVRYFVLSFSIFLRQIKKSAPDSWVERMSLTMWAHIR